MNDLVSIIIPVYKVEKYLDECLESLVRQTYSNLEIILVDDGSPDNSPAICDNWAKIDARVKVIHKENKGVCAARNSGLDIANGEYISFVDSDDVAEPKYIEKMYSALQSYPDCGIAACCAVILSNKTEKSFYRPEWCFPETVFIEPEEYADKLLTHERSYTVWGKLYKKEVIADTRFRDVYANEELFLAWDLTARIEGEKIKEVEIPDILYNYRRNPDSIVHAAGYKFILTGTTYREMLALEVKNKKPLVYNYYKKTLLLDYLSTIHLKFEKNVKEIPYYGFCKKLWNYSDKYAKNNLQKKEYTFYYLLKYVPSITYLVLKVKQIFSR